MTDLLLNKVGEYVRGQSGVSDLYAWLAARDAEISVAPGRWGDVWQLLHAHYAEALSESTLRAELAHLLSPASAVAGMPRTQTVATSGFQLVRAFQPAVTVQFRMATA
jgi:hypothetical protein